MRRGGVCRSVGLCMWGEGASELVGVRTWNSEDEGNREAYFVRVWWCARVVVWCDARRFEVAL